MEVVGERCHSLTPQSNVLTDHFLEFFYNQFTFANESAFIKYTFPYLISDGIQSDVIIKYTLYTGLFVD